MDNSDNGSLKPYGASNTFSNVLATVTPNAQGVSATFWVVNYENMDYLKLDSSGKCPNGTTPTESNPRCN